CLRYAPGQRHAEAAMVSSDDDPPGPGGERESGPAPSDADVFAERLFSATLGAIDVLAVYVADRLGWYRALADVGPLTSTGLAERPGTHERYARECLEQQASSGILVAEDPGAAPAVGADPAVVGG